MQQQESTLEQRICRYVRLCGGRAYKFVSPGCPGVPDRLCVMPYGYIVFVEVKRPGRQNGLSPQQKKIIKWLRTMGQTVWVINDFDDFREKLKWQGYEPHAV